MKINFLNAQNYILGKTEKKKLLSKFFIEKNIAYYLYEMINLNKFINSWKFPIFIYIIYAFIVLLLYYFKSIAVNDLMPFLSVPVIWLFLYTILTFQYIPISSIKEYFITKRPNIVAFMIKFFLLIFTSGYFILEFFQGSSFIGFFLFLLSIYPIFIISRINIINIVFLILYFPYLSLYFLYSLINIYYIKGIKGYSFIKNKPKQNILKRFNTIKIDSAENIFYKVKLKV